MPAETIVTRAGGGRMPYSKGLMAQALSASGVAPDRAFELARFIEGRLSHQPERTIDTVALRELAEEVVRGEEGEEAVRRFHQWQRIDRLDRPLIVMLSGAAGVGKSTLATMLANRLGITRVIATDVIRQVLRAFFSREFMPAVHYSSFEAGDAVEEPLGDEEGDPDLVGFGRQAESVATGVQAIVERACHERTPMVIEGVHLVPGFLDDELRTRCVPVEAVIAVEDYDTHRDHFGGRGEDRPAQRYLDRFEQIRKLQGHLLERAREENVAVIDNAGVDDAIRRLIELVLGAAERVDPERS